MGFIRFIQSRRHPESGVEDGLFGLAYELRDSPRVEVEDRVALADALTWFAKHLETPSRFNRTKSKGFYRRNTRVIAWFKDTQDKLDRLDEAFLFERSIDIDTYDRHAEKLREELTLVRIDRHSGQLDELDVEDILAFAERVLPRAADLWVQASLEQKQRFQQLFVPEGIAFDGKALLEPA